MFTFRSIIYFLGALQLFAQAHEFSMESRALSAELMSPTKQRHPAETLPNPHPHVTFFAGGMTQLIYGRVRHICRAIKDGDLASRHISFFHNFPYLPGKLGLAEVLHAKADMEKLRLLLQTCPFPNEWLTTGGSQFLAYWLLPGTYYVAFPYNQGR